MNSRVVKKLLLAVFILMFTSGCSLMYGDDLLSLPKLPGEYVQLQRALDEILGSGASYAVAETGANRQAVQLVDLDGDGSDEALAFFRTAEGTYQVYSFRQTENGYARFDMAEGYGNTLRSIYYPACGADGTFAVAIGWGYEDTNLYGMTVLRLTDHGFSTVLDLTYADVTIMDIDGDGAEELAFAVRDSVTGLYGARIYRFQEESYSQLLEVAMCLEVKNVASMQFSPTLSGDKALFIDSQGISGGYVTDVISYDGRVASNQTIDPASGSGSATWRPLSVFSTDVDGDGVLDVPVGRSGDTEQRNRLQWCDFAGGVSSHIVGSTYHSPAESWYLVWPDNWDEAVQTTKSSGANLSKTSFSVLQSTGIQQEPDEEYPEKKGLLLSIWVFSGDNRQEHMQVYPNLRALKTTASAIYCYSLSESDFPSYALTDEQVAALFHTIEANWQSEVY